MAPPAFDTGKPVKLVLNGCWMFTSVLMGLFMMMVFFGPRGDKTDAEPLDQELRGHDASRAAWRGCLRLLGLVVACMDTDTGYKTQSYTCSHAGLSTVTLATSKGLFRGCGGVPQAAALKRWPAVSARRLALTWQGRRRRWSALAVVLLSLPFCI